MKEAWHTLFLVIDVLFKSIGKGAHILYTLVSWAEEETRDLLAEEAQTRVLAELADIKAAHQPKSK